MNQNGDSIKGLRWQKWVKKFVFKSYWISEVGYYTLNFDDERGCFDVVSQFLIDLNTVSTLKLYRSGIVLWQRSSTFIIR